MWNSSWSLLDPPTSNIYYMCAVDTWPGFPELGNRARSADCEFCSFLEETMLTSFQSSQTSVTMVIWVRCVFALRPENSPRTQPEATKPSPSYLDSVSIHLSGIEPTSKLLWNKNDVWIANVETKCGKYPLDIWTTVNPQDVNISGWQNSVGGK